MRLGTRIFLVTSLLILVAVGAAGLLSWVLATRVARESLEQRLQRSALVRATEEGQRYDRLQLLANVFVADANLLAYIEEAISRGLSGSILDILIQRQPDLGYDFAMVTDADGIVLARTDRPDLAGSDVYDVPLVAVAIEQFRAAGVWSDQGGLYHAVAIPLVRGLDLVGFFVLAYQINDQTARATELLADTAVTILRPAGDGFAVVASSLDSDRARAARLALVEHSDEVHRVLEEGVAVSRIELDVEGERWIGQLSPLLDAAGSPVGATLATESMARALAPFRRIGLGLAASGLLVVLLVSGLTYVLVTRAMRPVASLVEATAAARTGRYDRPLPSGRSDEVGQLAMAFQDLLDELRERHDMEQYVASLQRNLPDKESTPASATLAQTYEVDEMTLLGFDFRRHGRAVQDAVGAISELSGDVERVRSAVRRFSGRIDALAGHRVWAVFDGVAHSQRAVGAAAALVEAQLGAGLAEEALPAVVLTRGQVGRGATGAVPSQVAMAGRPVAELESLMREAVPGELLVSDRLAKEIASTALDRGVNLRTRRGVTTPLQFVALDLADARRLAQGLDRTTLSELRTRQSQVRPGSTFGDRYEIISELGAGGMGMVYKARDRDLDDVVALKVLRSQAWDDPKVVERIKQELKLARMITHPNVIRVHDFGELDGTPFISMEYVHGITLRQLLQRSDRVPYSAALRLARQICQGLQAVHQAGVVHCDLKPENIILEPTGNARLMDFGISQAERLSRADGAPKTLMGTPRYLAPEQVEHGGADVSSDIYAAGMVLYELFTGGYPYGRGNNLIELLRNIREHEPTAPAELWPEIPPRLSDILMRCLRKIPQKRYASMAELLVDLEALSPRRASLELKTA